jgi:hypothetical protein
MFDKIPAATTAAIEKTTPIILSASQLADSIEEFVSYRQLAYQKGYNKGLFVGVVATIVIATAINHYDKKQGTWKS